MERPIHSPETLARKRGEFNEAKARLFAFLAQVTHSNCGRDKEDDPNIFEKYETLEENFRAALDFWAN